MKKRFLGLIVFLFALCNISFTQAAIDLEDEKLDLEFFYSQTCPHCAKEKSFLNDYSLKDADISINEYALEDSENLDILVNYYEEYEVPEEYYGHVPILFIEDRYIIGFSDETKEDLNQIADNFFEGKELSDSETYDAYSKLDGDKVTIPILGEVSIKDVSPFVLSASFGVLDGFNACAMAALAILLAMLIGMGDRKKLILIGGVFILVSGAVYYAFMAAWLNLFLVLPHLKFLTILTGIIVIVFSVLILKEYFSGVVCKLCEIDPNKQSWFAKQEKKLMAKMQTLISDKTSPILMILGVIVISAGINLIELVCSFGLPVAFTKILTAYGLSSFDYYLNLLVYIIFYMLDDFVIFLIAVFTFNLAQESDKYIKFAKLLSGILLLILGIIMIFFPNVLGLV